MGAGQRPFSVDIFSSNSLLSTKSSFKEKQNLKKTPAQYIKKRFLEEDSRFTTEQIKAGNCHLRYTNLVSVRPPQDFCEDS